MATKNPKGEEAKRPQQGASPDPFEAILGDARSLRDKSVNETDPEKAQNFVRGADAILKRIAALQTEVGKARGEIGNHVMKLRQAKPKGKPAEGTRRVLANGEQMIFMDGSWYTYVPPATEQEEHKA